LSNELFAQLCQVVQLCVDSANFPIYIHCLDGRRITSVFVLMLRKVQAWNPVSSFTEYWRYV
jgi:tyrosine-protein phosphatase OCA6